MHIPKAQIMQSNQSFLLAYLESIRSGSGLASSGNDSGSNSSNAIGSNFGTTHDTESRQSVMSPAKRSLQVPSHYITNQALVNAEASLPTLVGTSDDELLMARQTTATMINQYFTRQDEIEQREKFLLEQQISSAMTTSPLLQPILEQLHQRQPQNVPLRHLNPSLLTNTGMYNNLITELLHQNQDRQGYLSIPELQRLQSPLLSTAQLAESISMNQLQQLQQIEVQNNLHRLRMNIAARSVLANSEPSVLNPRQIDSTSLLSNYDTISQARILSSVQDRRQSSITSMAAKQLYRQNASRLLTSNTSPIPFQSSVEMMPVRKNDRKLCASSRGNDDKKIVHRMGRVGKFPLKLHILLSELKEQGCTDVAAFLPHGLAFCIFDTSEFADNIMPLHFRMSRYSSFQRQLNLYDFQRITEGPDKGAYHHHLFVEGQPDLLCGMKRNKIKGIIGKNQPNKLELSAATSNVVASAMSTVKGDADLDEQDDDNETDTESDIS